MSPNRFTLLLMIAPLLLAGCLGPYNQEEPPAATPVTRNIRMWVEPLDWPIHPNVTTPVWAFCAEGDGVEPVHGEPCGVPGPTIRVTKGDRVVLTFENTHTIPHTVHFHGQHPFAADMNGNGLIDGGMVAEGGETRVVEWIAEPAGTFIYHCHFATPTHMEMGMSGAFIVEDPAEAENPDKEFVAVLDEWAIGDDVPFLGNIPAYNFFTISGKSFPLTIPWLVDAGDHVRVHLVNAGYEFHAMHIHGYTPWSWEGVAGPAYRVPTDVREIAPGQSVVLDFEADRKGVWLVHDHVVPRVTAASNGAGYGAYPRGMLTILAVGDEYHAAVAGLAPTLLAAAANDVQDPEAGHGGHGDSSRADADTGETRVIMKNVVYDIPTVHVAAGSTVTWVNKDPMGHTVTADDGGFDSGDIPPSASWSFTFTEPGTYTYHCIPHAVKDKNTGEWKGMVATVVVDAPDAAPADDADAEGS